MFPVYHKENQEGASNKYTPKTASIEYHWRFGGVNRDSHRPGLTGFCEERVAAVFSRLDPSTCLDLSTRPTNVKTNKLFCFPFAGGSSFSYRELAQAANSFDLHPLELPGRGRRAGESLARDIDVMVHDLLRQVDPDAGQFAFFGHSMGASLAWLAARQLADQRRRTPTVLFVSGCNAPMVREPRQWHLLPPDEFAQLLRDMGGCPPQVLADPDLLDYFVPIIRADFEAHAKFQCLETRPFEIPVVVFSGSDDPYVNPDGLQRWREVTSSHFECHLFPGGHFFLFDHWEAIRRLMETRLGR